MKNTKFFIELKATRPETYTALLEIAGSMKFFSVQFSGEKRKFLVSIYASMKMALLKTGSYRGDFLKSHLVNLFDRSEGSPTWNLLSERQLRRAKSQVKAA